MNREGEMIFDDVKKILNSGSDSVINALKLNVKAYLACINIEENCSEYLKESRADIDQCGEDLVDMGRRLGFLEVEAQKKGEKVQGLKLVKK